MWCEGDKLLYSDKVPSKMSVPEDTLSLHFGPSLSSDRLNAASFTSSTFQAFKSIGPY